MKRTLGLAAVILLSISLIVEARAQNLEAGKSPGQIFSATCSACHRSPRGLLRNVPPSSLPGFLREHYTTSRDMAQQLSGFLIGNGASDPRARQDLRNDPRTDPRLGRQDARQDTRQDPRQDPRADPRGDPRFDSRADPRLDPRAQPDGRGPPQPPGAIPRQETRPGEAQQAAQPDGRIQPVDPRSREGRRLARQAVRDAAAARQERMQRLRGGRLTPEARIEASTLR